MSAYEHLRLIIWVFGVPLIIVLTLRAIRKTREIRQLHLQLLEEEKANPLPPQARLAQLYDEATTESSKPRQRRR